MPVTFSMCALLVKSFGSSGFLRHRANSASSAAFLSSLKGIKRFGSKLSSSRPASTVGLPQKVQKVATVLSSVISCAPQLGQW